MIVINRICFFFIFSTYFFLSSCIEPYNPNLTTYEGQLVIYGLITDEEGPYQVKITRTIALQQEIEKPEENAAVSILDENYNIVTLNEVRPGIYLTPEGFKGVVNKKYKLIVVLKNDKVYESGFVELIDVPEISKLSVEVISKENTFKEKEFGYQFYISVNEKENDLKYFRWSFDETWELPKPFSVSEFWDGKERHVVNLKTSCWVNSSIPKYIIASTDDFQSNEVIDKELVFVNNNEGRLSLRYCLHVKQFALSPESYFYWKSVNTTSSEQGSLYDKQPYQVIGNIECVDDCNEQVLGIFEASAVEYKRIFVGRLPRGISSDIYGFNTCIPEAFDEKRHTRPGYLSISNNLELYYSAYCIECAVVHGTMYMPEYWGEATNQK